jgi:hypothetical protein
MSDDTHQTPTTSSNVNETTGSNSVSNVTTAVDAPGALPRPSSQEQGTQTPKQSALVGLQIALENYTAERKANITEVLIAEEYVLYCKRKPRLKKPLRRLYIESIAKAFREVTKNPLFTYDFLYKTFKRLDRSEKQRKRRLLKTAKRKRSDREKAEKQARRDNEESKGTEGV